jgi:SSS family solute:Na+ symporter
VIDRLTPFIAIISPLFCYFLSKYSVVLLNGYKLGFELLLFNGLFMFLGLLLFSKKGSC